MATCSAAVNPGTGFWGGDLDQGNPSSLSSIRGCRGDGHRPEPSSSVACSLEFLQISTLVMGPPQPSSRTQHGARMVSDHRKVHWVPWEGPLSHGSFPPSVLSCGGPDWRTRGFFASEGERRMPRPLLCSDRHSKTQRQSRWWGC